MATQNILTARQGPGRSEERLLMHEFARYIQRWMDARGMRPADLAKATGMSPTHIGRMISDERPQLPEMPNRATIARLATALQRPEFEVMYEAAQAYGVPGLHAAIEVPTTTAVADDDLIQELSSRLRRTAPHQAASLDVSTLSDRTLPRLWDLLEQLQTDADAETDADYAVVLRWLASRLQEQIEATPRRRRDQ